jgi:hypothetical protein
MNFEKLNLVVDKNCKEISESKFENAYKLLNILNDIKIPSDPIESGLEEIHNLFSKISFHKDLVIKMNNAVVQVNTNHESSKKNKNAEYKQIFDELLSTDDEIKKLSSQDRRTSQIDFRVKEIVNEISKIEVNALKSKSLLNCIRIVMDELEQKREVLSRQFTIIQEEIKLNLVELKNNILCRKK